MLITENRWKNLYEFIIPIFWFIQLNCLLRSETLTSPASLPISASLPVSNIFKSTSPAMFRASSQVSSDAAALPIADSPFQRFNKCLHIISTQSLKSSFRFSPLFGTDSNRALIDSIIRVDHVNTIFSIISFVSGFSYFVSFSKTKQTVWWIWSPENLRRSAICAWSERLCAGHTRKY